MLSVDGGIQMFKIQSKIVVIFTVGPSQLLRQRVVGRICKHQTVAIERDAVVPSRNYSRIPERSA